MSELKHTPGPWRWEVNLKSKYVNLCGGVPEYDLTVMGFERWGMSQAAPVFLANSGIISLRKRCDEFTSVVPERAHHSSWFQTIKHPDAQLIAAAPDMLEALIELRDFYTGWSNLPAVKANAAIANALGM